MLQHRPSAQQRIAMFAVAGYGVGAVDRRVTFGGKKVSLTLIGPVFEAPGVLAVECTHFLQAHDVRIELLDRVPQVVNFQTPRRS
jgi:hypothetical protein